MKTAEELRIAQDKVKANRDPEMGHISYDDEGHICTLCGPSHLSVRGQSNGGSAYYVCGKCGARGWSGL